jgi:hypothetical protein
MKHSTALLLTAFLSCAAAPIVISRNKTVPCPKLFEVETTGLSHGLSTRDGMFSRSGTLFALVIYTVIY